MGSVALPTTGLVYVDANVVNYTVEKHPRYSPVLRPLWGAVAAGQARVIVSELILLETLVGPYRANDPQLADDYETFLRLPGLELVAVSPSILREAARLRSRWPRLKSPDAIRRVNPAGVEYWSSRDFARVLGYSEYRNFEPLRPKTNSVAIRCRAQLRRTKSIAKSGPRCVRQSKTSAENAHTLSGTLAASGSCDRSNRASSLTLRGGRVFREHPTRRVRLRSAIRET